MSGLRSGLVIMQGLVDELGGSSVAGHIADLRPSIPAQDRREAPAYCT